MIGGSDLFLGVLDTEDGLGVADGEEAIGDVALDGFLKVEEAHGVGDAGTGLADALGDLVLLHGEFFGELDVTGGFLDGVEVLALEVLDEGHLEDFLIGGFPLDDGDGGESECLGGPPAAFTGDEFEFSVDRADDEGLDDAVLLDGLHEFIELAFGKTLARLKRGGGDAGEFDFLNTLSGEEIDLGVGCCRGSGGVFDERSQSFS